MKFIQFFLGISAVIPESNGINEEQTAEKNKKKVKPKKEIKETNQAVPEPNKSHEVDVRSK